MPNPRKQELTRRLMEMSDEIADLEKRLSCLRVEVRSVKKEMAEIVHQEQEDQKSGQHQQTHLDL